MAQSFLSFPSFLAPPSRIAIAGDWHADTDYAVAAIEHAAKREATVLIHLGDFGYNFTDEYLNSLDETLARCQMTLGFVDGNHENFDRLLGWPVDPDGLRHLRAHLVHLPRGFRWRWGQTSCLALGGAYSLDRFMRTRGRSWWVQELITRKQVGDTAAAGPADAMFCHDCPAGITVPGAARDRLGFPERELRRSELHRLRLRSVVDAVRPGRLWHGHFHRRYQAVLYGQGYRTVVDGLGKNSNPVDNNMVVVNLAALGSHRLSAGGNGPARAALGGPTAVG
ncbi:Calcineurin-like phosphoesterase superfamily domain protein [Mycobacterium basiliense]|uniref:Calcineurin-like phosphoesterase superfamily domain protein n=1 Tax=Mycobacterium basiliense TaxID=2094119 RepID=A0A3S4DUK8_9MYCO|nr:metallophosphoesterase [Mycobacterium basiliense]VDM89511.1 Calcineurin-like phosphoesterase superfamily domain protein [Mycobacterium basiliense]